MGRSFSFTTNEELLWLMAGPSRRTSGGWVNAVRAWLVVTAVAGIALGLIMLFWPGITLLVVAALFGVTLIVGAVYRIVLGLSMHVCADARWLMGIFGVLMVIAGLLCLTRPVSTLVFIAIVIGVAWILEGVHDVLAGITGTTSGLRWLALLGGVLGVIAGIVVLALPGLALSTLATVGGILVIVVSILTLSMFPRRAPTRRDVSGRP